MLVRLFAVPPVLPSDAMQARFTPNSELVAAAVFHSKIIVEVEPSH